MTITILDRIEELIDNKYLNVALPHPNQVLAKWYFLIAIEDAQRIVLTRVDDVSAGSIEYFVDRTKYSMKYGLDRIGKECVDISHEVVPRRVNGFNYTRACELHSAGIEYSSASQICSSAHNGSISLTETDNVVRLNIDEKFHQKGYALLEIMGHQPSDSVSFMQKIFWMLQGQVEIPFIVEQIADSVKIKGKMLSYEYDSYLAANLSTIFQQPPFLIPENWKFAWGGRSETTLLLNAFSLRCAYHFLAIHFYSVRKKLSGGGHESLVLVLDRHQLFRDIEILTSLSNQVVQTFVDTLTFGAGTKSPDPALQPIIPLDKNLVAIAPLHVLSCHLERNLLALHARTKSREFNAMSSAFENEMIGRIIKNLSLKWVDIRSNATCTFDNIKEEMDLLVADPKSRTLLLCELRWAIPPGDPREVQQKKQDCFEKVAQLKRKVAWLKPNAATAASQIFSIDTKKYSGDWNVIGAVIIDGFGGVQSPDDEYPILPSKIFEFSMGKIDALNVFGDWSKSLDWLPQENFYYEMKNREMELGEVKIIYEGMEAIQGRPEYYEYIAATIDRYATVMTN